MGERRERSQRNKIVTTLGSIATSAASLEVTAPGIVPPGVGTAVAAGAGLCAVLVNIWWPR